MDKPKKQSDMKELLVAFEEATSISMGLIVAPVLFLAIGVVVDKAIGTTPLFIFIAIICGVGVGVYQAYQMSKTRKVLTKKISKKQKK